MKTVAFGAMATTPTCPTCIGLTVMQRRNFLLCACLAASGCATKNVSKTLYSDSSVSQTLVHARPELGFAFPYILQMPIELPKVVEHIVIETNNSGPISRDFRPHVLPASELARTGLGGQVSIALRLPLVMPVFPRAADTYTHSLSRATLLTDSAGLQRLDIQLLAIGRDARQRLRAQWPMLGEKIIFTGFSASAMFATRMAILHPNAVHAIAAGGLNGFVTLPIENVGESRFTFPIGVGDLRQVSGHAFDRAQWSRIPQYLFMGELDTNDAVDFEDSFSSEHRMLIHAQMGKKMMPTRWNACRTVYEAANANAKFVTYAGIGHETNERVHTDVAGFLRCAGSPVERHGAAGADSSVTDTHSCSATLKHSTLGHPMGS